MLKSSKGILTSLVVAMVLVATIPTETPIYPVQENWIQYNEYKEEETEEENQTSDEDMLVKRVVYDDAYNVAGFGSRRASKIGSNYVWCAGNGAYAKSTDGKTYTHHYFGFSVGSTDYGVLSKYNVGGTDTLYFANILGPNGVFKLGLSYSTDGSSWTTTEAIVTDDAYNLFEGGFVKAIDIFYCNGHWYCILVATGTPSVVKFFNIDYSSANSIELNVEEVCCGWVDGNHYYFPVVKSGETATKLMDFDCSSFGSESLSDESTITTDQIIDNSCAADQQTYSESTVVLNINSFPCLLTMYDSNTKSDFWMLVNGTWNKKMTWDITHTFYSYIQLGLDTNLTAKYISIQIDDVAYYHEFNISNIISLGQVSGLPSLNTIIIDEMGYKCHIVYVDNPNYLGGVLTQENHLSPRTLEFIDESASVVKGQGMVVYDKNSNLIFTGKIKNLVPESDITGITSYKVQCEELAKYDLDRPVTADAGYTDKDPHEPIDDVMSNYALFLYEGTLDDQSLTYDLMWKKDTKLSLIFDDGEEIGGKWFHWDPDGKAYFDDADLDPTKGAITLNDNNCHLLDDGYQILGKNENKIEIRGGVTSAGVPVYGTYTELKETDLSVGTSIYEISGLVDDSSTNTNAIAKRIHDLHNNNIHLYKGIATGVGCPETGKIATFSSTALAISSVTIIFDKIVYDIDSDSIYFEAYDYLIIKPDSNNDSKLNESNTNRVYQVAGGSFTGGGIANVVEDTTPQLGGNLDVNGKTIQNIPNNTAITFKDTAGNPTGEFKLNDSNFFQTNKNWDFGGANELKNIKLNNAINANGKQINFVADPTSDQDVETKKHCADTYLPIAINVAGTFTAGNCYYYTGSAWALADSDAGTLSSSCIVGYCASTNVLTLFGRVTKSSHGFNLFVPLYVSTSGTLTHTQPTPSSSQVMMAIGFAIDSNTLFINALSPSFNTS